MPKRTNARQPSSSGAPAPHLGVTPHVDAKTTSIEIMQDRLGGDAAVMVLKNLLTDADIATLKKLGPTGVSKEHDRYEGLEFSHTVWRFEKALQTEANALYHKVVGAMLYADREMWRCVPCGDDKVSRLLHPEIEFIVYDAEKAKQTGDELPKIGPHVDNSSCVTMVALLSSFGSDFDGGINLFEDGNGGKIGDGKHRAVRPCRGDALLFRGERCEHSLTEVTRGCRTILQIELCRKREGYH